MINRKRRIESAEQSPCVFYLPNNDVYEYIHAARYVTRLQFGSLERPMRKQRNLAHSRFLSHHCVQTTVNISGTYGLGHMYASAKCQTIVMCVGFTCKTQLKRDTEY